MRELEYNGCASYFRGKTPLFKKFLYRYHSHNFVYCVYNYVI